jgi:predicted ATPase
MKLRKIVLENFRSYKDRYEINIEDLTAFIGRNEAGKSTIFDALDIFFNTEKPVPNDVNIKSDNKYIRIGCAFDEFPKEIVIDDTVETTLKDEYLLNQDGLLEIHKTFDCSSGAVTSKKVKIYFHAYHPTGDLAELHLKGQKDFQKIVKELSLKAEDGRTNKNLRKAIRDVHPEEMKSLQIRDIDASKHFEQIEKYLPICKLFKVDRANTDQDDDVQDPFKLAIKEAIADAKERLDLITTEIRQTLEKVTVETIEKLKEIHPEIADKLEPEISEPGWDKIFKVSVKDQQGIELNKRGSGTRRLLLLSFLLAEAERKQKSAELSVILAIEEPEVSQHPDNQRLLLDAFKNIVEKSQYQILISTHTPEIAAGMEMSSLRLITKENDIPKIDDGKSNPEIYSQICETLGLHSSLDPEKIGLVIFVEGPTDVEFIRNLSHQLHKENQNIIDLCDTSNKLAFLPLGGSNLKAYATKNYYLTHHLKHLNICGYGFFDSDIGSKNGHKYEKDIVALKAQEIEIVELKKRTIENYLHHDAISEVLHIKIEPFNDTDDVCEKIVNTPNNPYTKKDTCKRKLNLNASQKMSIARLNEKDPNGEIMKILTTIKEKLL